MPCRLPIENAMHGVRFQPMYSVAEKVIKAWELLGLIHPGINHKQYLASQSCLNILCWQLQINYKMKSRKRYYSNVRAGLLRSSQYSEQLLPWLREGVVLEVQEPLSLSKLVRRGTRQVKSVLVKRVENSQRFAIAKEGGSDFPQKVMWPEKQFFISYTPGKLC